MSPRGRRGGGARSEDDRQRARLEREQRRAQREGRPVPRSIDDLPVAEPSIDAAGLGLAGAGEDPPPSRASSDAPASGSASDPRTRRQRLQELREGTAATDAASGARDASPVADRPGPRDAADPAPSRDESATPPPAGSQPWWSTAAGGSAPPPPPAGGAPAPPRSSARPARDTAAETAPPARRRTTSATETDPPARRRTTSAAQTAPPSDADPIRAPGVLGPPPGGAPRGRGRDGSGASPAAREAEDWFGPDRTENPRTPPDRDAPAEPALVPLRPAGPARPTGTAPATVHTRTAPARRGVSRIAALLVLVPFVVGIAAAVFLFQPFSGDGEGEVRVKIPPGSSVDDIGKLLEERGVVSNSLAFAIRARLSGDGANLKAGTLRLKRGMSYGAALTALQQDPLPPSVIRVAIPEGLSRSEVATSIKRSGVTGSYLTASARASGFDPQDFGQPRARKGLEGFLFPATYELQRGGATAKDLVAEQLKSFRTNVEKVSMRRARRAKLSPYEVLIIASMIEREVRIPSERRLVSAVIWNRLEQDIALGIDATTRYAVKNWTRPLKQSEIDRNTPYDTRRRKGLPPTPIGSPGLSAIRAAANPADVSYLYYVVEPCGDGKHAFASTDAAFQKDVAAYNAAQKRAGGDPSPSDAKGCKAK